MKNKIRQLGFSLVELSVVMTVIGITLSGALVLATKKTESDKIVETNFKLNKIQLAIEAYLLRVESIPCPSNGSHSAEITFGVQGSASEGGGNGVCSASNYSAGNIYSGVVPVKTLHLPDDYMFDAWGRRITYVIDARFANNSFTNGSCNGGTLSGEKVCFRYQPNGAISVRDAAGRNRTTEAIYVLISHGKNGFGAWKNIGDANRLPQPAAPDGDEEENAGNDNSATFDNIFVQKDETPTFDDIVRYKIKWQIMEDARAVNDLDLCYSADDSANICAGAGSTTECIAMANQIRTWCLDM